MLTHTVKGTWKARSEDLVCPHLSHNRASQSGKLQYKSTVVTVFACSSCCRGCDHQMRLQDGSTGGGWVGASQRDSTGQKVQVTICTSHGLSTVLVMLRYKAQAMRGDRQYGQAMQGHCISTRQTGNMGMSRNCIVGPAIPPTTTAIPFAIQLDTRGTSSTGGGEPTRLCIRFHLLAQHPSRQSVHPACNCPSLCSTVIGQKHASTLSPACC